MIKRMEYLDRIRPFIGTELIKVLTGIRRCGKSVMLELIKEELLMQGILDKQFISYNFEDMKNLHLLTAATLRDDLIEKINVIDGKVYLFFDEIQEVQDWEKAINSFRVEFDCDIYITGSNAKLLSGELATYLSGRYVEFVIYPFSFKEFTLLYGEEFADADIRDVFTKYLKLGGMPYLNHLHFAEEPSRMYLQDLYNALLLKDIVKRNKIRDVDLLERIISYMIANIGTTFSATNIAKYFKSEGRTVSVDTVLNYIKACESAFLFYQVKREDLQGKKMLSVNEKYYIADQGIRESVFGSNQRDINLVLENIVFMELLRRGYDVTIGRYGDKEVDFIATKQEQRIYVQVAYMLASEETIEREFSVLEKIEDNFQKYVVTLDDFDMSRNGIIHKNMRAFLMEDIAHI